MPFSFNLPRALRKLKLKLAGKEIIVSGRCRQCGSCCRSINLRIDGKWINSPRQFEKLKKEDPDYERFEILGRNRFGTLDFACTLVQAEGTCGDYENRPDFCREFPQKELFVEDCDLPPECAYRVEEGVPFEKVFEKQLKKGRRDPEDS